MTDRELLEMAAKAAGIPVEWDGDGFVRPVPFKGFTNYEQPWNPLADDGDALRLLRRLELDISHDNERNAVSVTNQCDVSIEVGMPDEAGDIYATLRRAIVRAAAEIGKEMS